MRILQKFALLYLSLATVFCVAAQHSAAETSEYLGNAMPPVDSLKPGSATAESVRLPEGELGSGWIGQLSRVEKTLGGAVQSANLRRRGPAEVALYARAASSIVLVFTDDDFGSGVIVGDRGEILTNWHVVSGQKSIRLIYKPKVEGLKLASSDLRRAQVVALDETRDLALLEVTEPAEGYDPLPLGSMDQVAVGADVHAIGHPTGEHWTYTRGVISQLRKNYEWSTRSGQMHRASVIQTQTPISPGSSGGPLLDDSGEIVGINSFSDPKSYALNYAVAVDDISTFLSRSRLKADSSLRKMPCRQVILAQGQRVQSGGRLTLLDRDCNGVADAAVFEPDDANQPTSFLLDENGDGIVEAVLFDADRDGGVETSIWDVDGDGEHDLRGYHTDGGWEPRRLESIQ